MTRTKTTANERCWHLLLALALVGTGAAGCGSGGGGGEGGFQGPPPPQFVGFDGNADASGPFATGVITAFRFDNGVVGASLGESSAFGGDGTFSVPVTQQTTYSGPVMLQASGTFLDPASGTLVASGGSPLRVLLPSYVAGSSFEQIVLSPFTEMAASRALVLLGSTNLSVQDSLSSAFTALSDRLSVTVGGLERVPPANLSDASSRNQNDTDALTEGLILAGISQEAQDLGVPVTALIACMASDFADGFLDGTPCAAIPAYGAGTVTTGLAAAIGEFVSGPQNQSGLSSSDSIVTGLMTYLSNPPPGPGIAVLAVQASKTAAAPGDRLGFTVSVQNTGPSTAAPVVVAPFASRNGVFGAFNGSAGNPTGIGAGQTALFSFTSSVQTNAPTGPVTVNAMASGQEAGQTVVSSGAASGAQVTIGPPPGVPGTFTLLLQAPGAIGKAPVASGAFTPAQTTVTLSMTAAASNTTTATAGSFSLRLTNGALDVTSQYAFTNPAPLTLAPGQTRAVTWLVTALSSATKLALIKLTATAQFTGAGAAVAGSAADNWYVRDRAVALLGQPAFTTSFPGTSATTFRSPGWFLSDSGGRLIVSDTGNNRVLVYASQAQTVPAAVIGQQSFLAGSANGPGGGLPQANTLSAPSGLAVTGNRLVVVDSGNNRVVMYDGYQSFSGISAPSASVILGQPNAASSGANRGLGAAVANGFSSPAGVAVTGTYLAVGDTGNNRVVVYSNFTSLATLNDGFTASATGVLGQRCLNGVTCGQTNESGTDPARGVSPNGMSAPTGLAFWRSSLAVADTGNSRVLVFNNFPARAAATTTDSAADLVIGQPSFTTSASPSPPSASSLALPKGVWVTGNKLFVGDTGNNRVLVYGGFEQLSVAGAPATDLFGQELFSQGQANTAATPPNGPSGSPSQTASTNGAPDPFSDSAVSGVFSADGSSVWLADALNNRVLRVLVP